MKKSYLMMPALLAALLVVGAPSQAQDRYQGGDRGHQDQRNDNRRDNGPRGDNRHDGRDYRDNDRRDNHRDNDRRADNRRWDGAGPSHDLRRGGRLPTQYRTRQYVVDDWRGHHLRQPPRGYHWVQTGPDYVLAAIATGVIADLLINSR